MAAIDAAQPREQDQYTPVAKTLHWTIVGLLIAQYVLGWTMPDQRPGTTPDTLIDLHLSVGAAILLVMVARVVWRLTHAVPPPPDGLPGWQLLASRVAHTALYALLLLIPMLGWAAASWRSWPVTLFHTVSLPSIVPARQSGVTTFLQSPQAGDLHTVLSYLLLGVIALHVAGALFHRFVLRDRVLHRMLPKALS
jgi:cytochrome b561